MFKRFTKSIFAQPLFVFFKGLCMSRRVISAAARFDTLVKCKVIVEGVDWVKEVFIAFHMGVSGPGCAFFGFAAIVPLRLPFCFVFLDVFAVNVFDDCTFFFIFTTLPESSKVEVFFLVVFSCLKW